MSASKAEIQAIFQRVDETLQTARHGLEDLLDSGRTRRMTGLRNLIVFGRSVTFVLQNLRSLLPTEFDQWYEPRQHALKADPLMRYFVDARNELEKQGRLNVTMNAHIKFFSAGDIRKFGPPPAGAGAFFIGDQLGGTGWEVKLPDGTVEKYYVDLPPEVGTVTQHFANLPAAHATELQGFTVEQLSQRFLDRLAELVAEARQHFLPPDQPPAPKG